MPVIASRLDGIVADGLVAVTIDRPPVNALDIEHLQMLTEQFERLAREPGVRGVVLTGSGGSFSAGVDTKAYEQYSSTDRRRLFPTIDRMISVILALPVPLGVAINAHALGGGLVLSLTGDVRYVASGPFRLGLPEIVSGIAFPGAAVEVITRELTPGVIRRLVIGGEVIGPDEALSLGFVDGIVESERLIETVAEHVAQLAEYPAFAEVKGQFRSITS